MRCGATGCAWIGTVSNLEKHSSECGFTLIPCTNKCMIDSNVSSLGEEPLRIHRQNLKYHLQHECPMRLYECTNCGEEGKYQDITGNHLNHCPMMTVSCPSEECSMEYNRKDEEEHKNICQYVAVTCKYDSLGCSVKKMRREMPEHIQSDSKDHITCALSTIRELRRTITDLKDTLSALEERHTPTLTEGSSFTFRITGFEAKKSNNDTYKSKPFYLHNNHGHKVCIILFPNGNGEQKECLYVTAQPLQSPSVKLDNYRLLIKLLNQAADSHNHKSYLVPNMSHTDWNGTKLVSHEDLYQNSDYVRNDSLFLSVSIAPRENKWIGCLLELEIKS